MVIPRQFIPSLPTKGQPWMEIYLLDARHSDYWITWTRNEFLRVYLKTYLYPYPNHAIPPRLVDSKILSKVFISKCFSV